MFLQWLLIFFMSVVGSGEALTMRHYLPQARKGDFIVTAQNKNHTLLHIYDKTPTTLTIEEITIPSARIPSTFSWREWVRQGGPHHTSWILYAINQQTGQIEECFSVSQNGWLNLSKSESFLPTLLNLELTPIPTSQLRRVGPPPVDESQDRRPIWQPNMVVDGKIIKGVPFEAWRAQWPKDESELSGKVIEIYLPAESTKYPSYFPYWLQVKSLVGKASARIVDSGTQLISPAAPIPKRPSMP